MRFLTLLGTRPQFIKASQLSLRLRQKHKEILVDTGQHYDFLMAGIFAHELDLPRPDYDLKIGSGTHAQQTAQMLLSLEPILMTEKPDIVVVFGDTNTTLAGALAAAKLGIPVAHIEAGLRSFNRQMPEEINRIVTDHLSRWLFAPSDTACENLGREGMQEHVYNVGDIMLDAVLHYREVARNRAEFMLLQGVAPGKYSVVTIHRPENTDDPGHLQTLLNALAVVPMTMIFPVHPRTKARCERFAIKMPANVRCIDPLGYIDMLALEMNAAYILTDSGGVQKEAYYLGIPCLSLRKESEWVETVSSGWNILVGMEAGKILQAMQGERWADRPRPPFYGDGHTAGEIASILEASFT